MVLIRHKPTTDLGKGFAGQNGLASLAGIAAPDTTDVE